MVIAPGPTPEETGGLRNGGHGRRCWTGVTDPGMSGSCTTVVAALWSATDGAPASLPSWRIWVGDPVRFTLSIVSTSTATTNRQTAAGPTCAPSTTIAAT